METILITGANRVIGFGLFGRIFNRIYYRVIVCCRIQELANKLHELSRVYSNRLTMALVYV